MMHKKKIGKICYLTVAHNKEKRKKGKKVVFS